MEKFGCTSPYFASKENICTNITHSREVIKILDQAKRIFGKRCLHPCKYLQAQFILTEEAGYMYKCKGRKCSRIELNFQAVTKKTTAFYSYDTLSLFAEVGGYLGLLLGYSVYNLTDIIEYFCQKTNNKDI